jgi:hypothetical protein
VFKQKLVMVGLVVATAGCSVSEHVSPEQYVPANSPPEILVRVSAGVVYALEQPQVVGDKLRGVDLHTRDTVAVPLSTVEEAVITRKSPVRTGILVGALTAVAGAAALFERGGKGDSCKLIDDHDDVVGKGTLCEEISDPRNPPQ